MEKFRSHSRLTLTVGAVLAVLIVVAVLISSGLFAGSSTSKKRTPAGAVSHFSVLLPSDKNLRKHVYSVFVTVVSGSNQILYGRRIFDGQLNPMTLPAGAHIIAFTASPCHSDLTCNLINTGAVALGAVPIKPGMTATEIVVQPHCVAVALPKQKKRAAAKAKAAKLTVTPAELSCSAKAITRRVP